MAKLIVAKYQGRLIHISEYMEQIHRGHLTCPFCSYPLKVTFNIKGFFMAWRDKGGHNCSKKPYTKFLDTEWLGKNYVDVFPNSSNLLEICIRIDEMTMDMQREDKESVPVDKKVSKKQNQGLRGNRVFTEVIKSVAQMKNLVEQKGGLTKLDVRFKVGTNYKITLSEMVILCHKQQKAPTYEKRFVVFKVERLVVKDGHTFINSFIMEGYQMTAILEHEDKSARIKSLENNYIIVYGTTSRRSNIPNKLFIDVQNVYHIEILDEFLGQEMFNNCSIKAFKTRATS